MNERPARERITDGRRRAVILDVRPSVDGGRYAIKRVVGDLLAAEADILADGHDVLRGMLCFRHESEGEFREVPLEPAGSDLFRATFELTSLGRYFFTVVAWVDAFATWRHGLGRKMAVGVDVSLELREGAALAAAAAGRAAGTEDAARLEEMAVVLAANGSVAERAAAALRPAALAAAERHPDRSLATRHGHPLEVVVERPLSRCSAWYEMFPRSTGAPGTHGTLRDAMQRLDYVAELGFDIVYLPPIHPIGRAFRKGPDNAPIASPTDPGSPWAIGGPEGGHDAVHPELGTLADFDAFIEAARSRRLEVALDVAFQASPDHPWVTEKPQWFRQRPDGSIQYAENPPKKYQDVYPFDFESNDWRALWDALAGIFIFWAEHGVRCFRVDNPHTKPLPFWEWCISTVKQRFPDAIFLAEAFTRPKLTHALAKVGFSQSYTYFTWRTTKPELTEYLEELTQTELVEFFQPNFWPTTPDILPEHLQYGPRAAFTSRAVLAATLSSNYGIYGPAYELMERIPRAGAEELAQNEKYEIRDWDLTRADSLRPVLTRLNHIRRAHAALHTNRSLRFHPTDNDLVICYSKRTEDRSDVVLVVVNLDPHHTHAAWLTLDLEELGIEADRTFQVSDLLGDARYTWRGPRNYVELTPDAVAHVMALRRFHRSENQFEYYL